MENFTLIWKLDLSKKVSTNDNIMGFVDAIRFQNKNFIMNMVADRSFNVVFRFK